MKQINDKLKQQIATVSTVSLKPYLSFIYEENGGARTYPNAKKALNAPEAVLFI